MAENDGTPATGDATQAGEGGAQAAPEPQASASGTPDVTTLLSRIAGLDAKVSTLSTETKAEKAAREAAEKKLADYEAGLVKGDEALRAQLAAKETELETIRKDAALARIEAKFPETYAVLGEAAISLTADQLAAAEARFSGVQAGQPAAPKPVPNAASRADGQPAGASPADETSEDILKRMAASLPDWMRPSI